MTRRLCKSHSDRMIAGVCGGLGEYFGVDPVLVRLAFVLLSLVTGIAFLAYPVLWIVMPEESSVDRHPRDVVRENLAKLQEDAQKLGAELRNKPSKVGLAEPNASVESGNPSNRQLVAGVVVLLLGLVLLVQNLNLFWWASLFRLWPLALVALGALLLYEQARARR